MNHTPRVSWQRTTAVLAMVLLALVFGFVRLVPAVGVLGAAIVIGLIVTVSVVMLIWFRRDGSEQ